MLIELFIILLCKKIFLKEKNIAIFCWFYYVFSFSIFYSSILLISHNSNLVTIQSRFLSYKTVILIINGNFWIAVKQCMKYFLFRNLETTRELLRSKLANVSGVSEISKKISIFTLMNNFKNCSVLLI